MPKLIIIQGLSGTGKTTVSRLLSQKLHLPVLEYDSFLFGFHRFRPLKKKEHDIANKNLFSCLKNYFQEDKTILLEGALVAHDGRVNTFNLTSVIAFAKKHGYSVQHIILKANKTVSYRRMKKRGSVVPLDVYEKLAKKISKWLSKADKVVDTSKLTKEEMVKQVEGACLL
ncbi:MAG: AAA family ATPase [Candidatus Nanoarchaeia archaeon]